MLTADVQKTLYLLWGGAFVVLLIGGLNIANLALARSLFAVRNWPPASLLAPAERSLCAN